MMPLSERSVEEAPLPLTSGRRKETQESERATAGSIPDKMVASTPVYVMYSKWRYGRLAWR
jgi:hypothetical protein